MAELDLNSIFPDQNRRFTVVVCPKCREHAQVLEPADKKTTRCQHCGALLRIRKLRVFYSSDELSEAVAARTRLQARLSGKEAADFLEKLAKEPEVPAFDSEKLEKPVLLPVERAKKAAFPKKSAREILFELLEMDPEMDEEKLKAAALERGVDPEKYEKLIRRPAERAKKAVSSKNSARKILFELLEASGRKMELEELKAAAFEREVNLEKFEKTLKELLASGELYSPSKGVIKIV